MKLVYENRGEKLGVARKDLNERIAAAIEKAELDADQQAKLQRLLGQDYEVITADDRLLKIAQDFVEHCAARWEAGKAMLVCIDKAILSPGHRPIQERKRFLPGKWAIQVLNSLTTTSAVVTSKSSMCACSRSLTQGLRGEGAKARLQASAAAT